MNNYSERPGGLLALAIINFVVGGFSILSGLGNLGTLLAWEKIPWDKNDAMTKMKADFDRIGFEPSPLIFSIVVLGICTSVVAIFAGVGYLKLRRRMGRGLGNIYGILGITLAVLESSAMNVGMMLYVVVLYPTLTLILINTTFKDDLVR